MIKVLVFIASRHRPLMLRNAILQMTMQTYPVDCCVYINSNLNQPEKTDYSSLLDDIKQIYDRKLHIKYGESLNQHKNYMASLAQVDVDDYDLFLKIDDDDIYSLNYVNDIVEDFKQNQWDMSGEYSKGLINGAQWLKTHTIKNIGSKIGPKETGVPGTWAFSREAIKSVIALSGDTQFYEDRYWKAHFMKTDQFKLNLRNSPNNNYHYNFHGANTSTKSYFDENWGKEDVGESREIEPEPAELTLNSFQAIRTAFYLVAKALPFLPKDLYVKLRSKIHFR